LGPEAFTGPPPKAGEPAKDLPAESPVTLDEVRPKEKAAPHWRSIVGEVVSSTLTVATYAAMGLLYCCAHSH
jgi:hypothetical protein